MRTMIADSLAIFVNLVTLGFGPVRRTKMRTRIRDKIAERLTIKTARGQFHTIGRVLDFHEYEPDTLEWIDEFPDDAVFWDIGANIGLFSFYAALRPHTRVLAFEPAAATYAGLSEGIFLNGMGERIWCYPIALAGETKLDFLNMSSINAGKAMHGFGTNRDQFGRLINTQFRQSTLGFTIDDFVRFLQPPLPTHVKLDVDGIEANIIRGGRVTLSASTVRSMLVEIEGVMDSMHNREIFVRMEQLGFYARAKKSLNYRNVIFDRL